VKHFFKNKKMNEEEFGFETEAIRTQNAHNT
jgi:hypothetical protein